VTTDHAASRTPSDKRRARTYALIGLVVVIFAAAYVFGQALSNKTSPSSTTSTANAGFNCVPLSLIPQLKPGESGTMTTRYGGFIAVFRSSIPASSTAYPVSGMPFRGTLTLNGDGKSWTLPGADSPATSQINEMCVITFQRGQHPGVMIEGFTGGAHCCETPVIYLYNGALGRYVKVVDMSPIDFENPHAFDADEGFIPKVVGSQILLQTADDQFAYRFSCYACEILPIVLDSVGLNGLTDVTPQHPSLVEAAARTEWRYVEASLKAEGASSQSTVPYPFGFLAPWVAEECTLGHGASAWSKVEQLQREGKLSDALYYKAMMQHGSFVAKLHSFLLRDDYCTGQF
jgi:hypothetical protein